MFAIGTSEFVVMGLLSQIADAMNVGTSSAGKLVTAYALGVAVGAPLFILVLSRCPRPIALLLLLGLFVAAHVVASISPTMPLLVVARFLSGLPHGAFFGIGAVVASALVPTNRQGTAISVVLGGLTAANIVGVPVGTWLAQTAGWRWTFFTIAVLGVLASIAVAATVGRAGPFPVPSLRSEISGLFNRRSIATLTTVAIGFAGLFTLYAYVEPLLTEVTGLSTSSIPWALAVIGIGFTFGNFVGGWATDRNLSLTLLVSLAILAAALATTPLTMGNTATALLAVFVIGAATFAAEPPIQKKLIEQAPSAPTLASATNQSAFNLANALGAVAGGLVVSSGQSLTFLGPVGAAFVVAGWALAWRSLRNNA